MKNLHNGVRIAIGLIFIIIAGSKFGLLPSAVNMPEMFTPEGFAFISAIKANGYLFPAVGVISLLGGLAFLFNRYVALGALILVPITVNFALFHIFLGFPELSARELISYVPLVLNVYMLYSQRERYGGLLES